MPIRLAHTLVAGLALSTAFAFPAVAQMASDNMMAEDSMMMENPTVGGAAMMADMNIVENAVNSPINTTLVAAVQAAGLVETLQGPGPFTVFAPTDDAFAALPAGTVETLLEPANLAMLQKVLTAHVVSGTYTAADLMQMAEDSDTGAFGLTTVSGDTLSFQIRSGDLIAFSETGAIASFDTVDVMQSNGVIHVVDTVLVPE